MKVREALEKASGMLRKNNIYSYDSEAKYLMKYALDEDDIFMITGLEEELTGEEEEKFFEVVEKRCGHVPFAYITGRKEFMGLEFRVNEHTLIPRPESENIVEYLLYRYTGKSPKVLELGVGSGCIIVSVARYIKDAVITGVDISEEAVRISSENAALHEVSERAEFFLSDLFENVTGQFDVIISNPPYIKSSDIDTLESDVKDYEPRLALDGGADGLDFYRRIAAESTDYLSDGGMLIMEIGFDQAEDVTKLLQENGFYDIEVIKDLAGLDRTISARKKTR